MRLDSARNAKAEIFREAFGYVEEAAAFSAGAGAVFVPEVLTEADSRMELARRQDPRLGVAVGIAPADRGSRHGREDYQIVMLAQQEDAAAAALAERAQTIAAGEVRVVYTGPVMAQSIWQPANRRPLQPGISAGHFNITAGTLGGLVRIGAEVRMLSNNHVFADVNAAAPGDDILQPGPYDGGSRPAAVAGALRDFERIAFTTGSVNFMDAATASIGQGIQISNQYPVESGAPATISGAATEAVDVNDQVFKVGRTTGYTRGQVFAIEVDQLIVNFGEPGSPRLARFDNQIQVFSQTGHFSRGGDSGSFVVDPQGRVVGLLFAGSDRGGPTGYGLTSINPIAPVLDRFGAAIWTG